MIRVFKRDEPEWFTTWEKGASRNRRPSFKMLYGGDKVRLKYALIEEQGALCCYCGRRIDRLGSHIEHFRPQKNYEELDVDYKNLHASCMGETDETRPRVPMHCGHAKGDKFDEALHISPLDENCEKKFKYTLSGKVLPCGDDEKSKYMIDLLKLNAGSLVNLRKSVLNSLFPSEFIDSASDDELQTMRSAFEARNESGTFEEFRQVICRFIDLILPES
jgi:uncharacterized protein (TIGR02646 family)